MNNRNIFCALGILTFGLSLTSCVVVALVWNVHFDIDVQDRLKRAADANQPSISLVEIEAVIAHLDSKSYCEREQYTSVVSNSPDEDVCFWRTNIEETAEDLRQLPEGASHLEKSNTLI